MPINSTLQVAGFCMAVVALIMAMVTCMEPHWKQNDRSGQVMENIRRFEGLWEKCTSSAVGINACDQFDHFIIGLPRLLLAGRFFTCFGIVFLGFGALINIFGLSCIQTNQTDQMKAKVSVGAGFLVLLGSLSIGIAVSWYAAEVAQTWGNPMLMQGGFGGGFGGVGTGGRVVSNEYISNDRYVLGWALFIGWGAMAVGIAGGILGVCASWSAMNEDDGADDYNMGYDKGPAYDAGRPNGYV